MSGSKLNFHFLMNSSKAQRLLEREILIDISLWKVMKALKQKLFNFSTYNISKSFYKCKNVYNIIYVLTINNSDINNNNNFDVSVCACVCV